MVPRRPNSEAPLGEHLGGHERVEDLEVHAEGAVHEDEHHDEDEVRPLGQVAQAVAGRALGLGLWSWMKLVATHEGDGQEHRQEAHRVEQQRRADPEGCDRDSRRARSNESGAIERRGVEADSVGQQLGRHDFRDEGLACGVVEGGDDALHEGEGVDVPQLDHAGRHQRPESEGRDGQQHLGDHEQRALGDAVRDRPGVGGEDRDGEELQSRDDAQGRAGAVGELGEDQPVLTDPLDPGADVADERTSEEVAVVADGERSRGDGSTSKGYLQQQVCGAAQERVLLGRHAGDVVEHPGVPAGDGLIDHLTAGVR